MVLAPDSKARAAAERARRQAESEASTNGGEATLVARPASPRTPTGPQRHRPPEAEASGTPAPPSLSRAGPGPTRRTTENIRCAAAGHRARRRRTTEVPPCPR